MDIGSVGSGSMLGHPMLNDLVSFQWHPSLLIHDPFTIITLETAEVIPPKLQGVSTIQGIITIIFSHFIVFIPSYYIFYLILLCLNEMQLV